MIWACDEKRGAICRKEGDGNGNESTRENEEKNAYKKMVWT